MTQTALHDAPLTARVSALCAGPSDFDRIYLEAGGDPARVPWATLRPDPLVESWLNRDACGVLRPGARVAIVGCGLGDDVELFAERGYDVLGLDAAPTAVEWARRRFPSHAGRFETVDVTALPSRLSRRFDLVVEAHTFASLTLDARPWLAAGIASLARPHGVALAISRVRDGQAAGAETAGLPTERELLDLMGAQGLAPACDPWMGPDADDGGARWRGLFRRAGA